MGTRLRWIGRLMVATMLAATGISSAEGQANADWTLLLYLNGKNNLEEAALTDFYEMAEVGSSQRVNVVVQIGRPQVHHTSADEGWSGVYRFRVTKGMTPRPANALMDLHAAGLGTDMADPATLDNFLRWGLKTFPAKKYMMVIWNHGQGWRFQLAKDPLLKQAGAKARRSSTESQLLIGVPASMRATGGYRAVSTDDDTGNILYNRQIQDVLEKLAGEGRRFDVVGFDACLMAMIETAYALRKTAAYMVASQELEPGSGWNYRSVLRELTKNPTLSPLDVSKVLVREYKNHYQDGDRTTLSAIDLAQVSSLAQALSTLSDQVRAELDTQRSRITAARSSVRSFADWYSPPLHTSIDLQKFLEQLRRDNPSQRIQEKIDAVLGSLRRAVVANYRAGPVVNDGYGGNGLAIYFPRDKMAFDEDEWKDGYLPTNPKYPLEFVQSPSTNGWARFLLAYLQVN